MGENKGKAKGKEQENKQKADSKKPQKKRSFKAKVVRFLFFLVFVVLLAGVGHFYMIHKRFPKSVQDAKFIGKDISKFFVSSTNLIKQKWKELNLSKKTRALVKGFEDLLKKKPKKVATGTSKEPTSEKASIGVSKARGHLLESKKLFDQGKEKLGNFRDSRSQTDLNQARKFFEDSRNELKKARKLTEDKGQQEAIDHQIEEVQKLLVDCAAMGNM